MRSRGSSLPACLWRVVYFSPPPTVASASVFVSFSTAAVFASWLARKSGERGSIFVAMTGYACSTTRPYYLVALRFGHGERDRGSEVRPSKLPHLQEADREG